MSRLESLLFFALLTVAAILRFAWPDLVFYGPDQGLLLAITDRFYDEQLWPWIGLVGTKGIFYGPLPSWVLILLRGLCPESVSLTTWFFYTINALHLAGLVYFLTGLRLVLKRSMWWFFAVFALTSPHLTFYARLLWDNTFLIVLSLLFGGFFLRQLHRSEINQPHSRFLWLWGGLTAGAAIDIHLFAVPFVVATGYACSAVTNATWKFRRRDAVVFVCAMMLLVAPYIYGLTHAPVLSDDHLADAFRITRLLTGLRAVVVHWSDWLTGAGFLRYVATGTESALIQASFGTSTGVARAFFGTGLLLQISASICGLLGIVQLLRMRICLLSTVELRLTVFAVLAAVGHLVLAVITDATQHLHYFQAVWWMPFVLAAVWWQRLGGHRWKNVVKVLVVLLVGWNLSTEILVGAFLRDNRGYITPQLGATLALQKDIVDAICESTPSKEIVFTRVIPEVPRSMVLWLGRRSNRCQDVVFLEADPGHDRIARYIDDPRPHILWEEK